MVEVNALDTKSERESLQNDEPPIDDRGKNLANAQSSIGKSDGLMELRAMEAAFNALGPLTVDARHRAVRWLAEALKVGLGRDEGARTIDSDNRYGDPLSASVRSDTTPRDFLSSKKPESLTERIACLGFYLATFRATPHFKLADISALNTEAAASKFGNPSREFNSAEKQQGYLAPATSGKKQLSARGEAVVRALPDRSAVQEALNENPFRGKRATSSIKKNSSNGK